VPHRFPSSLPHGPSRPNMRSEREKRLLAHACPSRLLSCSRHPRARYPLSSRGLTCARLGSQLAAVRRRRHRRRRYHRRDAQLAQKGNGVVGPVATRHAPGERRRMMRSCGGRGQSGAGRREVSAPTENGGEEIS